MEYQATICFILIMIFYQVKADSDWFDTSPDKLHRSLVAARQKKFSTKPKFSTMLFHPRSKLSDPPSQKTDSTSLNSEPQAQPIQVESEKDRTSGRLSELLSPDIFSKADPFQYLIEETSKIQTPEDLEQLNVELESRLDQNAYSENYIPYARALRAIVLSQYYLRTVKSKLEKIRTDPDCSSVPSNISSPPTFFATGLYSSDIFSDPDPMTRILDKILSIPKNDVLYIKIRWHNYVKMIYKLKNVPLAWFRYITYGEELVEFLKRDSLLDNLRRDMTELQRITAIRRQSSENTDSKNESELPATSTEKRNDLILST